MTGEKVVFVDVDTQFDFMDPDGKLYVPGAENLVPNLRRLINHAGSHKIPVISTADAHVHNDPEFKDFPPHCVKGEPGQERIPATQMEGAVVIPTEGPEPSLVIARQVIVEKQTIDVFENTRLEDVLKEVSPDRIYVFGVTTEYCVRAAALGLRKRGYPVVLVKDAVQAINDVDGDKALQKMEAAGVRFTTTDEVLAER
jgi:nicotinamidase/pyrazinamidase